MKWFVIFVLCIRGGHFLAGAQILDTGGAVTTTTPGPTTVSGISEESPEPRIGTSGVLDSGGSPQTNRTSAFGNVSRPTEVSVGQGLTEIFANESQSHESDSVAVGGATTVHSVGGNGSTPVTDDDGEVEGVARGKPSGTEGENSTTTPAPETLYQKTLALINDTYTMSILIPIAAAIVFASTIIVIIATCRCLRRKCRRRRLRRKALPDSVKNLRPSDRARLLAESSDEEF